MADTKTPSKLAANYSSSLGNRLRHVRTKNKWTLHQASKATGVAQSTLSKIENDLMSPTYDVLQKIALGMNIDLVQLFDNSHIHSSMGRYSINRHGKSITHSTEIYEYKILDTKINHKMILPFRAIIKLRSAPPKSEWMRHDGEKFVFVLSGSIRIFTELYEPDVLNVGDSAYFDSKMGHILVSIGDEDAEVLWMSTRPDPRWSQNRPTI